ncbi:MAG TPA: STM4015 family protein [Chloroflexia bacterium]|nr:STM4015 family protein [Chloroflexia bacterium]
MEVYEHSTRFAGYRVVEWRPGHPLAQAETTAYRIGQAWDEKHALPWPAKLDAFLADPASRQVPALVVGPWWDLDEGTAGTVELVVSALVAAQARLPSLTALFLGDVVSEENEISWIEQGDLSPLLTAYPQLKQLCVRGGNGLHFGPVQHAQLTTLIVQAGGLSPEVVQDVVGADLPALEHLELWLGTPDYGGDATVADLQPLLAGSRFPRLRYLGLRDSEIADEIATALAGAPILERLQVLDLSLGTLGDLGAEALLASPAIRRLTRLDLHHHYCSEAMMARLQALPIAVDTSDRQAVEDGDDESARFVAVGE